MPRDASGNYTLPAGNPVVTNTIISSTWANTTLADLATAMTNSLDRTGTAAGMTGQFKAAAGSVGAPGISFQLDPASGIYRFGANDYRFAVAGADTFKWSGAGVFLIDGAAATPSLGFINELTSGFSRLSAGRVAFSILGVEILDLQATTITGFNYVAGGNAVIRWINTDTAATHDMVETLTAGSTSLQLYVTNQNRASALVTGGPTVPQVVLDAFGTAGMFLVFATGAVFAASCDLNQAWIFGPPASGSITATVNAVNNSFGLKIVGGATSGQSYGLTINAGTTNGDINSQITNKAGTQNFLVIYGNGEVYIRENPGANSPPSGTWAAGYLDLPLNTQNANYTLALTDRGKAIVRSGATGPFAWTIPASTFPAGTVINLLGFPGMTGVTTVNVASGVSLYWVPSGTLVNTAGVARTLATTSFAATLWADSANVWLIWGSGIT